MLLADYTGSARKSLKSKIRWETSVAAVATVRVILLVIFTGAPNENFRKNICSEDHLRSRIFGTFVVKFLACLPLLGFSNI